MQTITTIGLDIAKSVFQVHGVDAEGKVIVRRQLKRRQFLEECQNVATVPLLREGVPIGVFALIMTHNHQKNAEGDAVAVDSSAETFLNGCSRHSLHPIRGATPMH